MVVSSVGGTPIRKANVYLVSEEGPQEERDSTNNDTDGRFSFSQIPSGHYSLVVSHPAYVGSVRPNGDPATKYTLAPGQEITDAVVRLVPAAVVRGRVVDADGDPVAQVQVEAVMAGKSGRDYVRNGPEGMARGNTDDRGEFRIFRIPPGRYYIKVSPTTDFSSGASISKKVQTEYVATYYPGIVNRENATALDLHGGDEIAVNIALQRANVYPVSGMFLNAKGAPVQLGMVTVMQGMQGVSGSSPVVAGKFELQLPPGRYVIRGMAMDQAGGGKFVTSGVGVDVAPSEAHKRIDVPEGGLHNLVLNVSPEHSSKVQMNGRIRVEDGASLPKGVNLFASLTSIEDEKSDESDDEDESDPFNFHDHGSGFAFVKPDGTFQIENVPDGTYLLQVGANSLGMEDWYTRSILLAGHDVLNSGIPVSDGDLQLDVVLSPRGGSFDGSVKDKDDQPVATSTVVIVPDSARAKRRDLYHTAETDQNGRFVMRGLEPGSYTAYAFAEEQPQIWFSAEAMKRYKDAGVAITVNVAGKAHADLRLVKSGQEQETQ